MSTDQAAAAFTAALQTDAGRPPADPGQLAAPPPRQDRDLEAPHGRAEDGTPLAPFGVKGDGSPRLKPGRPSSKDPAERPRVINAAASPASSGSAASSSSAAPAKTTAAEDYTEDLIGFGMSVWLGASCIRGGKLGPIRLPDVRPYALVLHEEIPRQAAVWNVAAQQNATVREYVKKLSADGSLTWMLGVGIAAAGLVGACVELGRAEQEVRDRAAAINDAKVKEYVAQSVDLAELGIADETPEQTAAAA